MKKNKHKKRGEPTLTTEAPKSALPLWVWLMGIIVLTIIAYWPAISNGFTDWDDTYYVTNNVAIRSLSVQSIFSFFHSLQTQGNYHPLTLLSLAIDYSLFGLNPMGYHVINILFHLINVCLVFLLMQKLFKQQFITIVTTLLFAIHPMHVESVAWVSERKDVLYVLFYLAGLWLYANYLDTKKEKNIVLMVFCFILSLLSKAQAVTFPLALLLTDYLRDGKITRQTVLRKIPLLILSLIFGVVAIYAQRQVNANELDIHYTIFDRIIFTGYAIALYILKLVLPIKLAALYPYPDKTNGSFSLLVYLSLLIPIAYAWLIIMFKKNKIVLSGLLFFLLNIALVLQILPVGDAIIAERYTYLSYLGLFWAIAYGINYLIEKRSNYKTALLSLCSIYIVALSYLCFERTFVWHDSMGLWQDELSVYNNVPVAWNNLGMLYETAGTPLEAKHCFTNAIALDNIYSISYSNRSLAEEQLSQFDSAIIDDNIALRLRPDNKSARQNRGVAYAMVGKADSSLLDCDWLVNHFPNEMTAHINHGLACNAAKKYDSAIVEFNWIIATDTPRAVIYASRGISFMMLNRFDESLADFKKALELDPNEWSVYGNRAHIYLVQGNNEMAIEDATTAIRNSNNNAVNNYITRAAAYNNLKMYSSALQDYLDLQRMGVPISEQLLADLKRKVGVK